MSTGKINTTQERFVTLARMQERIFHAEDLANIWKIKNKNTLYTLLKRYAHKGLLHRIYKGLYAIDEVSKLDPYELGAKALHGYCYLSTETVLAAAGIIQQKTSYITFVGSQSKRFHIAGYDYYCRQLKDACLFQDSGITKKNNVNVATVERAAADLLYFNPRAYLDGGATLNWLEVRRIKKILNY